MKHSDYITHLNNEEDKVYLRSKLLPVNMRLFNTSPEYKAIILQQCEYLKMLVTTKMEGYKLPHGMSSANAGLAFNIIAISRNRGDDKMYGEIMINPKITKLYGNIVDSLSNCGSLTLDAPIAIKRFENIRVEYYKENGTWHSTPFSREGGSFTIQHEIDHNNGILITERRTEESLLTDKVLLRN